MGVAPYLVANSLVGLVAQRLVRKVCPYCGKEVAPTAAETAIIGNSITTIRKGAGCHYCNNTGYKGRIAIHELVEIDKTIKRMISKQADTGEIYDYTRNEQHMVSLREQAIELVRQGITTPEEVLRVTYYSD